METLNSLLDTGVRLSAEVLASDTVWSRVLKAMESLTRLLPIKQTFFWTSLKRNLLTKFYIHFLSEFSVTFQIFHSESRCSIITARQRSPIPGVRGFFKLKTCKRRKQGLEISVFKKDKYISFHSLPENAAHLVDVNVNYWFCRY